LEGRDFDYIYRENPDEIILSACGILADRVPLIGDNLFIVKKAKQIIEEKRGNLYRIYNEATGKEPSLWSFVSSFSALTSREGKSLLLYLFEDGDISLKKEYLLRILKEEKLSMKLSKESLNLAKEFIDIREHFVLVVDKNIRLRSLGWIANVLKRKYYLPAVVIAYRKDGIWVGEGRSFPPISIYNAFNRIKDLFVDFGGHHYAAGFSIKQENLKFFDKKFEESIRKEKEKNWKEKVDILINGDYLHELEDILNLGKKNFYLSCYLENIKIEELRKSFGGQIYGIPAENGIYDMVLSIDENGGRVFWKSKQTE
jgi:single-stranded-DNA-specific exonuclease